MKLTLLRLNIYSCEFIKNSHTNGTRIVALAKILRRGIVFFFYLAKSTYSQMVLYLKNHKSKPINL